MRRLRKTMSDIGEAAKASHPGLSLSAFFLSESIEVYRQEVLRYALTRMNTDATFPPTPEG
jgi:hypothetical protein